jgi:hypothetical protein
MKNFIKANPYLGCTGLAVAANAAFGVYAVMDNKNFFGGFLDSVAFITLPSILVTTIDKYVNKNITENVPIQYALTAPESVLSQISIAGALNDKDFINNLFSLDIFDDDSIDPKVLVLSTLIQSLGFKYILDLADEQIEIENDQSLFGDDNLQDGL